MDDFTAALLSLASVEVASLYSATLSPIRGEDPKRWAIVLAGLIPHQRRQSISESILAVGSGCGLAMTVYVTQWLDCVVFWVVPGTGPGIVHMQYPVDCPKRDTWRPITGES